MSYPVRKAMLENWYPFSIQEDEKRAIAGIATLLTIWAAGKYGATSIYDGERK